MYHYLKSLGASRCLTECNVLLSAEIGNLFDLNMKGTVDASIESRHLITPLKHYLVNIFEEKVSNYNTL